MNGFGGWRPIIRVFLVSGTYVPSPGVAAAIVEAVGGGGGGGGATGNWISTTGWINGGGGGSSGGYSRSALPISVIGSGVQITCGAGGAGGAAGATGGNGTQTSFGAFVVALGGLGGLGNAMPGSPNGVGGPRPGPGIGDFTTPGNAGLGGTSLFVDTGAAAGFCTGGLGGMGFWGGAEQQQRALAGTFGGGNTPGALPPVLGCGGGGGASGGASWPATGIGGAPGACLITEWAFDGGSAPGPCPPFPFPPPGFPCPPTGFPPCR